MKKRALLLITLLMTMSAWGAYNVGDVVADFTFKDTNLNAQGSVVTSDRSVKGLIDGGKLIFLNFFFTS